jgi:large subunit ribosomal protein L21
MYAVVKTGGKQVKLEKGLTEVVEKLDGAVGDSVTFTPLFVSDDGKALVGADVASALVTAEIVEHFKGDKAIIFKFKKRKGYKVTKGHRQQLTRIRVTDIALESGAKPKKAAAAKAEAPADTAEAPAEAPAKKPAAKKPAAAKAKAAPKAEKAPAKKPAARKPAAKKEDNPAETAE